MFQKGLRGRIGAKSCRRMGGGMERGAGRRKGSELEIDGHSGGIESRGRIRILLWCATPQRTSNG